MTTQLGTGEYTYTELPHWGTLPSGWRLHEVADVVVGPDELIYVFNRGEHPIVVFRPDGTYVRSWGENLFTRAHGVTVGPDGNLYCADDDGHCIYVCTPEGQVLSTIGRPGQPAPALCGAPFNRPTKVAFDPATGALYIADGYGNARVHKYTPDGELLFSWGEFGTDPGQFNLVHSVAVDPSGRVYVADRENHRVQIFGPEGEFLEQWVNMHRPCGLHIEGERVYVGQLPTHLDVNAAYPNIGACVSIHDLSGQRLAKLGAAHAGEEPGQFVAPHGLAVASNGDLYVGEVSWSAYGRKLDPPRTARCLRKLVKAAPDD
jgi:DNA-binding beta-propeller fold protein YncE